MSESPVPSQNSKTILLVDDQKFVGMALARLLADQVDLKLACCFEADEAVAQAREIAPDLILQDLVMPKVDGLALVRMFREDPATATTPIVVLSGNDDALTRERALAGGANDYLVKLPPKADLVSCLRRHLGGSAASASAPAQASAGGDTLDPRVLAELRGPGSDGTSTFVPGLLDQFIQEVTAQVDALADASRRNDSAALAASTHRLKGGASTMGAARLAGLCGRLEEQFGRPGRVVATRVLVTAITEEATRVRDACDRERERGREGVRGQEKFEAHS